LWGTEKKRENFYLLGFFSFQTPHDGGSQTSVSSQADNTTVEKDLGEQSPAPLPSAASRSSIIPLPPPAKKQRVVGPITNQNELLCLACKYLDKSNEPQDNVPTIAKVWGVKLVALDQQQRLFAEKAINDILFEASLRNLHRHSVKLTRILIMKEILLFSLLLRHLGT
jgi:hypothetical protein